MIHCVRILIVISVLTFAIEIKAKPTDDGPSVRSEDRTQVLLSNDEILDDEKELAHEEESTDSSFFEGDIILDEKQKESLDEHGTRTGRINPFYRWPKDYEGYAVVPYIIAPESHYDTSEERKIRDGMNEIEQHTCIRFIERSNQEDFISIFSGQGCYSNLGKIGGQQDVSLKKKGCLRRGTIMHELIHALGYKHMHSHFQRDKYLEIEWDNIKQNAVSNFNKVKAEDYNDFGTKFDPYSCMMYGPKSFSKNDQYTIVPKDRELLKILGQRRGLSIGDVERINNMYNCTIGF